MVAVTKSLEDYLEAIFLISLEKGVARVKDVAKMLGVKKPSVVSAVKNLESLGLVSHEHYGYLELTKQGLKKAQEIYNRHRILFNFLHSILGVPEEIAEKDACNMEHYISPQSLERLLKLVEFLEDSQGEFLEKFKEFLKNREKKEEPMEKRLSQMKVGDKGIVKRIVGDPNLKRRLMNMGVVPGTEIRVEKVAPLGDPMDVVVKGFHLSLRKEEAENIVVEEA